MIKNSILEVVGETPIVELRKIREKYGLTGRIFCKLEYLNPTHSKKDRIAKKIIELALQNGKLQPHQPIVEATSGNTGIALSMVCAYLSHPFTAFMSEGNSEERVQMMKSFGTNVVIIPQEKSTYGSVTGQDFNSVKHAAKEFAEQQGAFFINQFENYDNIVAQMDFGNEITKVFDQNGLSIDVFCDYVGTGGSFTGASLKLKEYNSHCKCYVIEPENCSVLSGKHSKSQPHIIQGGGYGFREHELPNFKKELVDGYICVSDNEARSGMEELTKVEGIFGSFSSGANLMATIKALKLNENQNKNAVFSICDTGLKYLSVLK